jgi:DNA polymerase III epsilon subunit-like protein
MPTGKYIVLDTESTGLHSQKYGLIEIAMAVLDKKLEIIDTISFDVCPPKNTSFSKEALEINGFTRERITKGLPYKGSARKFHGFVKKHFPKDRAIFVAQFYPFDYAMIESMFMKVDMEKEFEEIVSNQFVDTKAIVLACNMKATMHGEVIPFPVPSLSKTGGLAEKFDLGDFPAHTALGDVLATVQVLKNVLDYVSTESLTKSKL